MSAAVIARPDEQTERLFLRPEEPVPEDGERRIRRRDFCVEED